MLPLHRYHAHCRQTVQPNDPRLVPLIGERGRLERLMQSHASVKDLVRNLETILPAFPEYRPVIGDGNCFYRWCVVHLHQD